MELHISMPNDNGVVYDHFVYPAGESQVRIRTEYVKKVEYATHIFVEYKIHNGDVMPLALLMDALKYMNPGAYYALDLPYLPYSRADRRFTAGDSHGLSTYGALINDLQFKHISTLDVHSTWAEVYIPGLVSLNPDAKIQGAVDQIRMNGGRNLAYLLPDAGAKRYALYNHPVFQAAKKRDPETGKLDGFTVPTALQLANVTDLLIVDDICDGGGTFVGLASELIRIVPHIHLNLYVTHGIFSKGLEKLSSYFERIFTTTSYYSRLNPPPAGVILV